MKLTEQQLADLFTHKTTSNTEGHVDACLQAMPASSTRLNHAEKILNDHSSAQGMRMAFGLKEWSEIMADSIKSSQQSWFNFLGMNSPLKTALATTAFAVAFVIAIPENNHTNSPNNMIEFSHSSDVINSVPFEGGNDQLSKGDFDGDNKSIDVLFDGSFG